MSSQQLDMADVIEWFHTQPEKLSTLNPVLVCLVQVGQNGDSISYGILGTVLEYTLLAY